MMKILIVDDEPAARRKIRAFLSGMEKPFSIEEASDGEEAVQRILANRPALVLLDIQMPGLSGFEVIEAVGAEDMPPVIFVTAYDQYAIDAFRVHAVDYLLKPFDEGRFREALQRAEDIAAHQANYAALLKRLLQEVQPNRDFLQRILVHVGDRYFFVPVADVLYFSAEDKYLKVHCPDRAYLIRASLADMEAQLNPARFVRIHRSHILNLDFLKEMHPRSHGDYTAVLINGEQLIISRRYRDRVF